MTAALHGGGVGPGSLPHPNNLGHSHMMALAALHLGAEQVPTPQVHAMAMAPPPPYHLPFHLNHSAGPYPRRRLSLGHPFVSNHSPPLLSVSSSSLRALLTLLTLCPPSLGPFIPSCTLDASHAPSACSICPFDDQPR